MKKRGFGEKKISLHLAVGMREMKKKTFKWNDRSIQNSSGSSSKINKKNGDRVVNVV